MMLRGRARKYLIHAVILAQLLLLAGRVAGAHDIPIDVRLIQMLAKPARRVVSTCWIRVPLKAMSDVEFPLSGAGFLPSDRVDNSLREAATLRISDLIEVYEADARLPEA